MNGIAPQLAFDVGGNRLVVLQLVRLLGATALLVIPLLTLDVSAELVPVAIAYVLVIGAIELLRRRAPEHAARLLSGTVLVDGFVVALAVAMTGGYRSPLLFLVFLDVMAVTVLASYRTGLKLAIWCALLLLLMHAADRAGLVSTGSSVTDRVAVVSAATFLLFAVCAAVFSSVNERALRHSRSQLELLVDLGTELERVHRVDDVVGTLARHMCDRLAFRRAAVLVHRDDRWIGAIAGGGVLALCDTVGGQAPVVVSAWEANAPLLLRTIEDPLLDGVLPEARNAVVAALTVDDEPLGVAIGEWGGGDEARIPMLTVQALAQAATHTALALRNAALLDEVERLATRDALTSLANRRLFEESLARETARSRRLRTPLSLVVLDVDHFKQVNDTYGHLTGDAVLREVARAIETGIKSFDVAARYGGDEFVVLLPGCGASDAVGVAERVRTQVAREVHGAPVTLSAGVATMPDNAIDSERLVAAADGALYEAKRGGRDRVAASVRAAEPATTPVDAVAPLRWRTQLARGA
jgi:diguanylate cyclase (GGDEF)-like protein